MPLELSQISSAVAPAAPVPPEAPPPVANVLAGRPSAVLVPPIVGRKTDPLQEWIVTNFSQLPDLGLDLFEPDPEHDPVSVLYNPKLVTEKQLREAYKTGKLSEIAPPASEVATKAAQLAGSGAPAAFESPPATPLATAAAEAPVATAAPLSSVGAGPSDALRDARIRALRPVAPVKPNPVPDQLAKRPV